MISSDVQEATLQIFLEVTKNAVESQAQEIQGESQMNHVMLGAQECLYRVQDFASEAQLEQFFSAVEDIIEQDGWNPSHGMIDKTWAERNALEEGM